jgi:hypothetical protein
MPVPFVTVPGLPVKISIELPMATWDSQVGAPVRNRQRRWVRLELEVRGLQRSGSAASAALLAARERVIALGGSFSTDMPSPGRRLLRAWLPAAPFYG